MPRHIQSKFDQIRLMADCQRGRFTDAPPVQSPKSVTMPGLLLLIVLICCRSNGHAEWVSCCKYLPDGRIVSGAMDSKVCVWAAKGVSSQTLEGHSGAVSALEVLKNQGTGVLVASASYDKSIRLWQVSPHHHHPRPTNLPPPPPPPPRAPARAPGLTGRSPDAIGMRFEAASHMQLISSALISRGSI